ncbi:aminotransferase class V-fold PLP-dependent enzyme [bacterium]|nr:aminotransferase class V-fold PLP-dependent enzyme [bacterium]
MLHFPKAPPAPAMKPTADFDAFLASYRASLPVVAKHIYLNHASVGPLSDWVAGAASEQFTQQQMAGPVSQDAWFDGWRLARQRIGELIGAERSEVCLQTNTYMGMLRVLSALPLGPGDEVVYPADEFPSLHYALSEARVQGCTVIAAESARGDGIVRTDDLLNALTPRTRLIATSWVNFFHGYVHDLERLGEACRERGCWLMLDAIQGLGMLTLDVKRSRAHFVAGQGAKWLCAPLGSGFLYVDDEVPKEITPRQEGWFAMELNHESYTDRNVKVKTNANRFGTGTVALPSAFGLRRACEVILEAGPERCQERALRHTDRIEQAARDAGITVYSDRSGLKSAIIALEADASSGLANALTKAGVVFSLREGILRLSPHWYLLDSEIDTVLNALGRAAKTSS